MRKCHIAQRSDESQNFCSEKTPEIETGVVCGPMSVSGVARSPFRIFHFTSRVGWRFLFSYYNTYVIPNPNELRNSDRLDGAAWSITHASSLKRHFMRLTKAINPFSVLTLDSWHLRPTDVSVL